MKIEYKNRPDLLDDEKEKELLKRISEREIQLDSLIFAQAGKIFYEKYFGIADSGRGVDIPNSAYTLNRMFSICKSFTAIAIGLLVDEGKISLSDRIVDYCPLLMDMDEAETTKFKTSGYMEFDERILRTSIEDMLTMRTPHSKTSYKEDMNSNWVNSFFTVTPDKEPGAEFAYDTSAAHVLCALCEKLTQMNMLDYLKYKMPQLDLSSESYIIKDPFGVSTGGTGLMCTSLDVFKFALLIRNKGLVDGKQLISSEYIDKAIDGIVDNSKKAKYPFEGCGYGYYFWRHEHGGYMCYGMWGQFALFYPQKDIIVVVTSNCSKHTGGVQELLDILWEYIDNFENVYMIEK